LKQLTKKTPITRETMKFAHWRRLSARHNGVTCTVAVLWSLEPLAWLNERTGEQINILRSIVYCALCTAPCGNKKPSCR